MLTVSGFQCQLPGSGFTLRVGCFRLCEGEIVYLRGPSGSGKTTFLNLLTGVRASPISATCREEFPRIDYVMHESSLLPWLTVNQNATLEASLRECRGLSDSFRDLCVEFGLEDDVLKLRATKLSLGMRQRVEIARALSFSPNLLVLDEAMAGIDAQTKLVVMERLRKSVHAEGLTVLATTHQLGDILRFAERVCTIEEGKVTGEVVFKRPVGERLMLSPDDLSHMDEFSTLLPS